MATGDTYRLSVQSTFTGADEVVNVFHYRQTAGDGAEPNKAQALIDAWVNSAKSAYLAIMPNRMSLIQYSVRGVDGSAEEAEQADGDNGVAGAGDVLPLTAAPIISWKTGLAGRRHRGRSYLPPSVEAWQDGSALTTAALTALFSFGTAALGLTTGEATPDEFELVIFSPEDLSATPPRAGTLITTVTTPVVREIMGSQRRRRPGTGS